MVIMDEKITVYHFLPSKRMPVCFCGLTHEHLHDEDIKYDMAEIIKKYVRENRRD